MDPAEELMNHLRKLARDNGIVDISSASTDLWDSDPLVSTRIRSGSKPMDLMPSAKSVVVIGIPVQSTILDTAPSIYYSQLYGTINAMLDRISERLALELNILGHEAVYVPRDGYHGINGLRDIPAAFFSHRHAAYLAGMGTFGMNNTILTPENGPRIRFSSVITSAELPSPGPMKEKLCTGCCKCVKACPIAAVASEDYPNGITDKQSCVEYSAGLAESGISPCGQCIKVCPVGKNRHSTPTPSSIEEIRRYVRK